MSLSCLEYIYKKRPVRQRYVLCLMVFLGIVNAYTTCNCLNIAMTEMVGPSVLRNSSCPEISQFQYFSSKTYQWNSDQVASVLSSFFPGYVIMHIPGGFLATKYGGKQMFGLAVILSAVLCAVSPLAVNIGNYRLLCIVRFCIGLAQGPLIPAVGTLLSKWVPKEERGRLGGIIMAASYIGLILCNIVSGYIILALQGWHWAFYFWALLSAVWYIFYLTLCFSEPSQNPYITEEEKKELVGEDVVTEHLKIPWKAIICYKPVIAIMVGEAGHDVMSYFAIVNLPKYYKDVLKFNILENGELTALPSLAAWLSSVISGIIADWVISAGYADSLTVRKTCSVIGCIFPSWCLVLAGYWGCNRNLAAVTFIVAMCLIGPFYPGLKINHLDITRNFSGVVSAYVNAFGTLSYYPISYIIATVAKNNLVEEWLMVFGIMFCINTVTIFVYDYWASVDRAPWDVV